MDGTACKSMERGNKEEHYEGNTSHHAKSESTHMKFLVYGCIRGFTHHRNQDVNVFRVQTTIKDTHIYLSAEGP